KTWVNGRPTLRKMKFGAPDKKLTPMQTSVKIVQAMFRSWAHKVCARETSSDAMIRSNNWIATSCRPAPTRRDQSTGWGGGYRDVSHRAKCQPGPNQLGADRDFAAW